MGIQKDGEFRVVDLLDKRFGIWSSEKGLSMNTRRGTKINYLQYMDMNKE